MYVCMYVFELVQLAHYLHVCHAEIYVGLPFHCLYVYICVYVCMYLNSYSLLTISVICHAELCLFSLSLYVLIYAVMIGCAICKFLLQKSECNPSVEV